MEKIGLKYGILTSIGLILYFLLMVLVGLVHIIELRFLNAIIMAVGVCMAIKTYKKSVNGMIPYLKGLGTGIITAASSTLIFAAFMVLFVKIGSSGLVEVLSANEFFGERVAETPGVVVFMILISEGFISGFMISFIAMQWFKRRDHKVPGSP